MKKLVFFIGVLFVGLAVHAQINFSTLNDPLWKNMGTTSLPSLLSSDMHKGEIDLFSMYGGISNNFLSVNQLQQFSESGNLSNDYIDHLLLKANNQNVLWVGADIPVMNIFFNVNKKKHKPFLTFGIGIREKADFNFNFNKNILSLLYQGNKQFADQTVNLSPEINFLMYNEIFVSAAAQFTLHNKLDKRKTMILKPAIRLRYLTGIASLYMPHADIDMFTQAQGKYIDFTSNFEANMSTVIDTPTFKNFSMEGNSLNFQQMMKGAGKGFGTDIGATLVVKKNIQIYVALVDIGSIRFTKNTINYTKYTTYRYEGYKLNTLGESQDSTLSFSDIEGWIHPDITYNAYTMPLGTKMIWSASYGIHPKVRKKVSYDVHTFFATYVQGFRNYLSTTKRPALNIGYNYSFHNAINTGANITLGGLNKVMGGAHLSLRLGVFKIGLASNNLLPLLTTKAGHGSDFNLAMGFYF